ncbi:MAG: UDP binding domain-containing protein, partial [Gemmatimonadales bacterium]
DPYVPAFEDDEHDMESVELTPDEIAAADCVVIATDHSNVDYGEVAARARQIVDTRNVLNSRPAS